MAYGLSLPNHESITYYRWDNLTKAKQDAQRVADGWHEYVEVVEVSRDAINVVYIAKPKADIAKVPQYNTYGNRTWDVEWKTDKPHKA